MEEWGLFATDGEKQGEQDERNVPEVFKGSRVRFDWGDLKSRRTTREGFEPSQREPKSLVLPLHYRVPVRVFTRTRVSLVFGTIQVKRGLVRGAKEAS